MVEKDGSVYIEKCGPTEEFIEDMKAALVELGVKMEQTNEGNDGIFLRLIKMERL